MNQSRASYDQCHNADEASVHRSNLNAGTSRLGDRGGVPVIMFDDVGLKKMRVCLLR